MDLVSKHLLSKREYIAAMILQGLFTGDAHSGQDRCGIAIKVTDELLHRLTQPKEDSLATHEWTETLRNEEGSEYNYERESFNIEEFCKTLLPNERHALFSCLRKNYEDEISWMATEFKV